MKILARIAVVVFVLLTFGCSRSDGQAAREIPVASASTLDTPAGDMVHAATRDSKSGFANLPDHGDLAAYPGKVVRQDGAYTWYRADLSEEHALRAIANGHLRVTTPEGESLDFQYDRHVEHPSGDWTWIGHRPGHESEQAILTFGDKAAFGSIAQSGKPPMRLTVRDGASWLVEIDPAKLAGIANAATKPKRPDYHIVPVSELPKNRSGQPRSAADGAMTNATPGATTASATTTAATTVDLLIGYTAGFASANGGVSGATTRVNYLVDVANAAYVNSKISAQVRVVKMMQVDYTDSNSNDTALEELSGYKSGTGPVTPNAAFNALRSAREQYGADLVSLVRDFEEPEHAGCGIAWLLGGGLQGLNADQGWDALGYSVVSDGLDAGTDGKNYYCLDETLAHELGHNMGAAHDKETSKGGDGTLDNPDDYGAYTYSFGYKTGTAAGNFYTIMAYGDSGQTIYRTFSSPVSTFCGGRACGSASEDNTRTLIKTIPVVSGFRDAVVPPTTSKTQGDFDGDGRFDILWRHGARGTNAIWRSGNSATPQAVTAVTNLAWTISGVGDFDGDGRADILWRNARSGANAIWRSGNSATPQAVRAVTDLAWTISGVGDFDGDGRSDILWRHAISGANAIWRSGNSATPQAVTAVTDLGWMVSGVGDFNGDGRSDILWRHDTRGANAIWRSGNSATPQAVTAVADQQWKVAG